jgi:hypothetical protein
VVYGQANQFHDPIAQSWTALTSRLAAGSTLQLPHWHVPPLTFDGTTDGVRVKFSWLEVPGAPPRTNRQAWEQVVLASGQWLQVRFNARHVDDDGRWHYEKHVLNVGVVGEFAPNLFVSDSPDYRLADLVDLQ